MSRTAVVVGASTGLGLALSECLAADGWDLIIASRTQNDLEETAAKLRTDHLVEVTPIAINVSHEDAVLKQFIDDVYEVATPEVVLITAGAVAPVDEGLGAWPTTSDLVATNMTGPMKLAGCFAELFEKRGSGTLVLFSSIAAGAPRRNNVAYSAAKAGLESFGRSMQHRLAGSGATVQLYRLGYIDTRLARGQDLKLPPADPHRVAARIVANLNSGSRTVFEPRYWGAIVRALRLLPARIYNKLRF